MSAKKEMSQYSSCLQRREPGFLLHLPSLSLHSSFRPGCLFSRIRAASGVLVFILIGVCVYSLDAREKEGSSEQRQITARTARKKTKEEREKERNERRRENVSRTSVVPVASRVPVLYT